MTTPKGKKDIEVKKSSGDEELSVEELKKKLSSVLDDNRKLLEDNKKLYEALNDRNEDRILRRLDFLLAVCNIKTFDDSAFQRRCAEEVEKMLTLPSEPAS